MSISAAQKTLPSDFLEKIYADTQPLGVYIKQTIHKEFLRFSDFSQGKKIANPHENSAHFQGIIKDETLLQCRYIVGGCTHTKAACAFLAHHAEQSSIASIECCTEEEFFNALHLPQTEKTEHQDCLLLGFRVLKKGILLKRTTNTPQKTLSPLIAQPAQQAPEDDLEMGALEFFKQFGTILLEEICDLTGS